MVDKNISILPPLNRSTAGIAEKRTPKIIQFGGGNFLRGFFDWMVDTLNEKTDFDAGVIVVKPTERGDYTALRNQDGLFHVSTNGIKDGQLISKNELVRCVNQVVHPYRAWETFLRTAELASIRFIVSNTTEAGIKVNSEDQFTDTPPKEFPAKLTRWLYRRFSYFKGNETKGCIIMPCELIENNGDALRSAILEYTRLWSLGDDFQKWILDHNIFCNTLVDRIVPGFPTTRKAELFQKIGYQDDLLVDAEPYHIFVIQSEKDIKDELPFHQTNLNVVFADDLASYRTLKVRILNGAHTLMVPVGYMSGLESVREAVESEIIGKYIQATLWEEIIPSLDFPPEVSEKYAAEILDRFRNPFIHHRLISIALNSITKFKTRLLPSLLDFYNKKNTLPPRIVFSFASLIWMYRGKRKSAIIPLQDNPETITFFKKLWSDFYNNTITIDDLVKTVLASVDFWQKDLNEVEGLRETLVKHLKDFEESGYQVSEDVGTT
ncbi:MAG: tagaturonate reductase [Bacteroidota bacterium]